MIVRKTDITPVEAGGWWRWLWLASTCLVCLSILGGVLTVISHLPSPTKHQFNAELLSFEQQAELKLPAMVPIKSIVVTSGQNVVEGQTIALLDQDLMTLELENLRRSILVGSSLRHCLLDPDAAVLLTSFPEDLDAESRLQMRTALKDCQLTHRENTLPLKRLEGLLTRQGKRLQLLERRAKLAFSLNQDATEKATTAVEFALKQERMRHQIAQLEYELKTLKTKQERTLLTRDHQLKIDVMQYRRHQATLERYLKSPRIQSPASGEVLHVRALGNVQYSRQDVTIATLQRSDMHTHRVIFNVPPEINKSLKLGDAVQLILTSPSKKTQSTNGTINALKPIAQPHISTQRAVVNVTSDMFDELGFETNGAIAAGTVTRAALTVSLEPKTLGQTLSQAVKTFTPKRGVDFWTFSAWPDRKQNENL